MSYLTVQYREGLRRLMADGLRHSAAAFLPIIQ